MNEMKLEVSLFLCLCSREPTSLRLVHVINFLFIGINGCYLFVCVVAPKEWVVVMDHNKYKCNVRGCDKAFRKASLLNYHVKYYHSAEQLESPCKKHKGCVLFWS